MSKGTPSFGKHHTTSHTTCRRCGRHTFHTAHKECAACGFPSAKIRKYNWQSRDVNRNRKENK